MKQMILLNLHSVVDIITNSSSELFVCNTNKDVDFIKELLQEMLDVYNKAKETSLEFKEIFGQIDRCNDPANMSLVKGYLEDYNYHNCKLNSNSIFILSASDNSIPFGLQELIEDIFNAYRVHLG